MDIGTVKEQAVWLYVLPTICLRVTLSISPMLAENRKQMA